ncbi:hypothetical protein NliqN6_5668 [Naganishia liquefaciens]|uniref:Uncharacterized protein n=1 Tax=Naganishia liquefaciens TaxID=104408 RepID=A0A8H3TX88_9TREE|nr:hypothetical protein NliqN6_5668 [Naganishia liquefaciens]
MFRNKLSDLKGEHMVYPGTNAGSIPSSSQGYTENHLTEAEHTRAGSTDATSELDPSWATSGKDCEQGTTSASSTVLDKKKTYEEVLKEARAGKKPVGKKPVEYVNLHRSKAHEESEGALTLAVVPDSSLSSSDQSLPAASPDNFPNYCKADYDSDNPAGEGPSGTRRSSSGR